MSTIFMNSEIIKTADLCRLVLNLTDELNFQRCDKHVALSDLSICYTWKNIDKYYKSKKFKTSGTT